MRTPDFWSRKYAPWALALAPLAPLYGWATAQRLKHGEAYAPGPPVICVGNVTAGGTGKTPVVQALTKRLISKGIAVHCLTRGHGGYLRGPVWVDPARHDASETGDEALLLAPLAPTWVAKDRAAGARAAANAGAQAILLDDGLQNPAVSKDLSLLVIDGGYGFGNGRLIPAGPLRETLTAALARSDAVILIGKDQTNAVARIPRDIPVIKAKIVTKPRTPLRDRRVVGFAGIGRPAKFLATLQGEGAKVAAWFPFADHHVYTAPDLRLLSASAAKTQAQLVTTEKDFVRLPLSFQERVEPVGIELVFETPEVLDALLDKVLRA